MELKLPPLVKSIAYKSKCSTVRLCSTVNSVQSEVKTSSYCRCSRGMLFLLMVYT